MLSSYIFVLSEIMARNNTFLQRRVTMKESAVTRKRSSRREIVSELFAKLLDTKAHALAFVSPA